jgi:hypothetical protein
MAQVKRAAKIAITSLRVSSICMLLAVPHCGGDQGRVVRVSIGIYQGEGEGENACLGSSSANGPVPGSMQERGIWRVVGPPFALSGAEHARSITTTTPPITTATNDARLVTSTSCRPGCACFTCVPGDLCGC